MVFDTWQLKEEQLLLIKVRVAAFLETISNKVKERGGHEECSLTSTDGQFANKIPVP